MSDVNSNSYFVFFKKFYEIWLGCFMICAVNQCLGYCFTGTMDDIFSMVREGRAIEVRVWLDHTENDLNQGLVFYYCCLLATSVT